ncbi:hypothetical protein Ahy_A01g000081 isoform A [Arachis hypogaea]|uniref:Pentatricopeptide repeat-containing protein n=1 Tax=Arachis hypogaea TaxID=3818 RepID=A0A445EJ88_ARAHY|nr:hypothetical protein Ahy_A01g000081 isoform A [Arachis hypogaea]
MLRLHLLAVLLAVVWSASSVAATYSVQSPRLRRKFFENPLRALEMFNSVKTEEGFKHTLLTYKCMVQKLGLHGEFENMENILSEMRTNLDNAILEGAYVEAMRSYGRRGKVQEAVDTFEHMDLFNCDPSVHSYNAIMNILVEHGYHNQAHKVYMRMKDRGVCSDVCTYTVRIKSFCRTRRPHAALRLLKNMHFMGCNSNAVAYCNVVEGFYESGCFDDAREVFDEMLERLLFPDVTTFNKLAHRLCKKGIVGESERLLSKVLKRGTGKVQDANRILKDAVFKGFQPDEFTYCSLINVLCQDGDPDQAMAIFKHGIEKGLRPSIVVYNTMIKGLSQLGLILPALQLMKEMAENGSHPNMWTYNLVINGLCKMGCVSDANDLVNDAIAKGCLPDIFTFNTLIDGYCKQQKLDTAIEMVNRMWSQGVTPDVITYNSLLNGLCKAAKSDEVMEIFKAMAEKGSAPNIITYNIIIECLCKDKKVNEALDLLGDMRSKGLAPDVVSFGTLITGFCKIGDLDGAYSLFRRMEKQYNVYHTTATYNIVLCAFSEQLNMKMAVKLFSEMKRNGCEPDNYTYRVMIDGFCKTANVTQGYNLLVENIEKGFIPSLITFGRVLNCLCMEDKLHEAVGIINLMIGKGIVPDIVNTIFEADKKVVAAPKIVVEDLLKKGHITYHSYELLFDGIRDRKILKKTLPTVKSHDRRATSAAVT